MQALVNFSKRCSRGFLWISIVIVIVLTLGWLSRAIWLPLLLGFLDVSRSPQTADVIVALGMSATRTATAIDLFNDGFAPQIIMSGCGNGFQEQLEALRDAGISDEVVLTIVGAQSTHEEAVRVMELLWEKEASSALIVTDAYHSRRAQATYEHLQRHPVVELAFVASNGQMTCNICTLEEYLKLAYYLIRYGVRPF